MLFFLNRSSKIILETEDEGFAYLDPTCCAIYIGSIG